MQLLAVLVGYYGAAGGSGIGGDDNASVEQASDDGGTGARSLGQRHALRM